MVDGSAQVYAVRYAVHFVMQFHTRDSYDVHLVRGGGRAKNQEMHAATMITMLRVECS